MSGRIGRVTIVAGLILGIHAWGADKVETKHILFAPAEKELAAEILGKLKAGEITWEKALHKYSIDVYTKRAGGRLGWITRASRLEPAVRSEALKTPAQQYAPQPIETQYGWHVIYVMKREKLATPPPPAPEPKKTTKPPRPPVSKLKMALELDRNDPVSADRLQLTLTVTNTGKETLQAFRPELWPLGVTITRDPVAEQDVGVTSAYVTGLGDTAKTLVNLLPGQGMVQTVRVGEVWDNASQEGYWEIDFSGEAMVKALEGIELGKDLQAADGYDALKKSWTTVTVPATGKVGYDIHAVPLDTSFYDKTFYVVFTLRDPQKSEFLVKLSNENTYGSQTRHFIRQVRRNYYNVVYFYDRKEGASIFGGAPKWDGSGESDRAIFMSASVLKKVSIKEKDFVLAARPKRFNFEGGGKFMIALKDLPDEKNAGVPVGTIVGGWETITKLASAEGWRSPGMKTIVSARLRTEDELPSEWKRALLTSRGVAEQKGPLPKATIETPRGTIELELYEDDAPNTVANFIELAEKGFYNNLTFHRVESWVIQSGDPKGTGRGGPGYTIKDEVNARKHVAGAVGMAKTQRPDSAGSQFYICKTAASHLDAMAMYTVFGKVTGGMDVVNKIQKGDTITTITITEKRDHEYKAEKLNVTEEAKE